MSLKNLVNNAKRKTSGHQLGNINVLGDPNEKPSFIGLDYQLTTRQPTQGEIKQTLYTIIDIIEANEQAGRDLTDDQKKKFLLIFYRLAFAQESRASGCFHPSEISTETTLCPRKMYFQRGSVPKDKSYIPFTAENRMQRLCDLGTMVHLYVQDNLERLNVLIDMESPVEDPSIGIKGKADGEIKFFGSDDLGKFYDEDMLLEVKTINDYAFKALRKPKPEHIKQASLYGGVKKYKNICFLYYNKNTSEHKVFVAPVDQKYFDDFSIFAKNLIGLFNKNAREARSSNVEDHKTIPEKICSGITVQRAMDCAYRDYCFNCKK